MKHLRSGSLAMLLALMLGAVADADRVRLVGGGSQPGEVIATSRQGVTLDSRGKETKIPIVQIKSVIFEGEPARLAQARLSYAAGGYETALENLRAIAGQAGGDLIGQDIRFYTLLCEARLAMTGAGDPAKAYTKLVGFVKKNRDSFHFYEAVETLGDLKASLGEYAAAEKMYIQIAKGPMPELKLRGRLLASRVSQQQGLHDEAIRRFDAVIKAAGNNEQSVPTLHAAKLGKAISLASSDRMNNAITLIGQVLSGLDEQETGAQAAAYNALGRCYEAADRPQDALFAYLHTDLLFNDDPKTHAAALSRLGELWKAVGKPDAAREAVQRLRREYAASKEARQAG